MAVLVLCLMLLMSVLSPMALSSEQVYFDVRDRRCDDFGSGKLKYPTDPLFSEGLFDLTRFRVGTLPDKIWFDLTFREVTNPFNAPEGYFHQRMEVYIDTGAEGGSSAIVVGEHKLALINDNTWQIRVSAGPFAETRVYMWIDGRLREFTQGIGSYLLEDGQTIRIEVPQELLPPITQDWQYYVLIGGFDALEPDNWRQAVDYSSQWQFEGTLPAADLLVPWWVLPGQKRQLTDGVLYPVQTRRLVTARLVGGLGLGVVFIGLI